MRLFYLPFSLVICLWCLSAKGQTPGASPQEHFSGVNTRGDEAMGFSHEKTTHHFYLFKDGGSIEIASNDPADTDAIQAVHEFLKFQIEDHQTGDSLEVQK